VRFLLISRNSTLPLPLKSVMVVGLGDAGKTTLVHQLLTDKFSPNQFLMTDGVSMKEWKPTPQMNFSLWDFGGQQMYLNTHAMLFADKTLYLLVWNPRAGTDPRVLEEYLLNIRSRSQSCLVMLVSTHGSEVDTKESEKLLPYLSKYAYLSHHNVDSCTGMGIDQLKQSIVSFVSQDFAEHS
jgi:GTPase SAR1 family protein